MQWRSQWGFRRLSPHLLMGEQISFRTGLFSVILGILHENVFQLHIIHTKTSIKNSWLRHWQHSYSLFRPIHVPSRKPSFSPIIATLLALVQAVRY